MHDLQDALVWNIIPRRIEDEPHHDSQAAHSGDTQQVLTPGGNTSNNHDQEVDSQAALSGDTPEDDIMTDDVDPGLFGIEQIVATHDYTLYIMPNCGCSITTSAYNRWMEQVNLDEPLTCPIIGCETPINVCPSTSLLETAAESKC